MRMSSAPSLEHRAGNSRDLVKIDFPVDDEVAREYGEYETMWARSLGDARYELRNIPIWVFDLSLGDEIFAKPNLDGDNLLFSGIAARGGHSTYRIRICREALAHGYQEAWRPLEELGCGQERWSETLRTIDVPREADIYRVYSLLEEGMCRSVWQFDELHVGHALN
jgi:hypothetical protein